VARPAFELAGIFRQYGESYRQAHKLPRPQLRVMRAIETCRTSVLGGHAEKCSQCDYSRVAYNSCRNRHCPDHKHRETVTLSRISTPSRLRSWSCQNTERARWLEARKAELLPVEYFHVVFTIPEELARIAFHNKQVVYGILFRAAAQTLLTLARDPKHLGAEIGFFGVLLTTSAAPLVALSGDKVSIRSAHVVNGDRTWCIIPTCISSSPAAD
jgi:hypothetical protein